MSDPESSIIKLSAQEKQWILNKHIKRLTDNEETLIYPMGAERYLSLVLSGNTKGRYPIKEDITNKDVIVIPGYGTSSFLFAQAGARSVTVYDKDPVTIAWMKAFKKYYNYREYSKTAFAYPSIGELIDALTLWYPPLLPLPQSSILKRLFWLLNPKSLRRAYIFYMIELVQNAINSKTTANFEYQKNIVFNTGEAAHIVKDHKHSHFDTIFVPYLLGVSNGIEQPQAIVAFIKQLLNLVPNGKIIVTPSRSNKEFHILGQNYFDTTGYPSLISIPELDFYLIFEDKYWFKTQGLAVFADKS